MANPVSWILSRIFSVFSKLDSKTKEKIIDIIVEAFQGAFRSYYQKKQYEESAKQSSGGKQSSDDTSFGTGTGGAQ
ncbi:MAG: hypothetical protein XD36_2109 [Halomonas sp. 54_146]|nr:MULTISPECIES: hypothetical protein [unclassified Halomonas]KUJ87503.1 MAG: hypothetical protein XD36_2109 [Halomonas sp. 54_146]HAA44422.1 hypothetical protein [Halomonas sp.]